MPSNVKEHHLRCLQQRHSIPSKRKRRAPEQSSHEENEDRSLGTSEVACSHDVGKNRPYEPFIEGNLHALAARTAESLPANMCTGHEPRIFQAPIGTGGAALPQHMAESAITTNFAAQMPGWSPSMSELWDDLVGQGATGTPSPVDCTMALFSRARSSAPGIGELGSCPISPGPFCRPLWHSEAEDPVQGALSGASGAADRHADVSVSNNAEAGVCPDESGSCLVRTDAAACSASMDVSGKSQAASAMLLQRDSPQPDAVPEQPGTAPAAFTEAPAATPPALLALPSSEAQQAAVEQAEALASPLQETAALVQGMLAAADAERDKALRRLKLLKKSIAVKDAEMDVLRQERDRAVADVQGAGELRVQLQLAQEHAAAADQKLAAVRGDLFTVRTAAEKQGRELTKENSVLKSELRDQQALNETIRTSSQNVRLQLEAAKVKVARAETAAAAALQEASEAGRKLEEAARAKADATAQLERVSRQAADAAIAVDAARTEAAEARANEDAAKAEAEDAKAEVHTMEHRLSLVIKAHTDDTGRLQADVARSLSENQQLAAALAEARADLEVSRASAEKQAEALGMEVQDLWCRLAAAKSIMAAASQRGLEELAALKAAQQAELSQALSEQSGRLQAAHEAQLAAIRENAERNISEQLVRMIQGGLYRPANNLVDSELDEGSVSEGDDNMCDAVAAASVGAAATN
ncbi:hypothetical protein COCOBI_18-1700 [Coccomyxa sp. Obi]|nr:hypothetical protein COCOBI_18-1700 [Coccomyxa sp. Obi]